MNQNDFPVGWDENRVRQLLDYYENQTEEEAVAEDESTWKAEGQTTMEIPSELVPAVRELIAKHLQGAA